MDARWRVTQAAWAAFQWNPRVVYVFQEESGQYKRKEIDFVIQPKPSWDELLNWADDLAMQFWKRRQPQRIGEFIKASRDTLLEAGIPHPRGATNLDIGAGLQHMPAMTYLANRSSGAGVAHPRSVMRNVDGELVEIWTETDAHKVLESLADRTNTLESARNTIHIRHVALEAIVKDPRGGLPHGSTEDAVRTARLAAYNQLFEESVPENLDRLMLTEAAKVEAHDDLPNNLPLAKEVLIERLELSLIHI